MLFKPLPPGLAKKLIEGIQDELTPLTEERRQSIKTRPCPRCKSAMHPFFDPRFMFSQHDPLPRTLARCTECGLELDPLTNLILSPGSAAKIENPYPLLSRDE